MPSFLLRRRMHDAGHPASAIPRPRAFEMRLRKPPAGTSLKRKAPDVVTVEPMCNAQITKGAEANWKLTSGKTTFWNAEARELRLPIIESKPPALTELEGAIITTRRLEPMDGAIRVSTGGIYDRDHNLLSPFLDRQAYEIAEKKEIRISNSNILDPTNISNPKLLKGKYIYLGIIRKHFGHFLLESLSHVWYLIKADPATKVIFHQYGPVGHLPAIVRYIFDLLELDLNRIVIVTEDSLVEHLIFPESEFEIRWKAHRSYSDTFTELYERSARRFPILSTPRNVYLTRRNIKIRHPEDLRRAITNEADVEMLFIKRGFTIIAPERLPIPKQIAIAAGADQIAGMKGSALHVSLFCQRPKARLVQIGRVQSVNQTLIDALKDMESHQILYNVASGKSGSVADLDVIDAALGEI